MCSLFATLAIVVAVPEVTRGPDGESAVRPAFRRFNAETDRSSRVVQRLCGRVLGAMIREGMAMSDVEQVLGSGFNMGACLNASGITLWCEYYDLGIIVVCYQNSMTAARVTDIRFWPIVD
ncbi:MAG: hypothetical protein FJ303_17160 [Planctomycetes bacterium]|nr:hypothetical protein [Planctomycetota bacterium]